MSARNVLFIMCDQLRWDYLSCYGHPHLSTPNIDQLAARGVRFTRAYTNAPLRGPARMSAYTGRYMRSHGSHFNGSPLRIGEPTLGDHLREIGVRNVLVGKTHMRADVAGMQRLGIDPTSIIGAHISQCGFEPYLRHDGLHPDGAYDPNPEYDSYLRSQGFDASNPWEHWANSALSDDGTLQSGWLNVHADKPARVPEEHSETPWTTRRAMAFMQEAAGDGRPWCLHLSYIKPHWPYIVPAPYHDMYGPEHLLPANRAESELVEPHPLFADFMNARVSRTFSREEVRQRVLPAYMGLIKQIDDQLGRLWQFLATTGLDRTTMIVFTSDHGDYLGDHWMGEKQLFHDCSVRIPMIVVDPSPEADRIRGTTSDALVEMIDLAPTFLEWHGGQPKPHILEGRSLMPLLHGKTVDWRQYAFSEYDYSGHRIRHQLRLTPPECRSVMVTDGRLKMVHVPGMRPMLFDLEADPGELCDLGGDERFAEHRQRLTEAVFIWLQQRRSRITVPELASLPLDHVSFKYDRTMDAGILIGYWDEADLRREKAKRAAALGLGASKPTDTTSSD